MSAQERSIKLVLLALLTRRCLQRLLNESATYLATAQVEGLVERLNSLAETIGAEWELIMLAALARMGNVEHAPVLSSRSSRLDVRFTSSEWPSFVADVRTVSDKDRDRRNPIDAFSGELGKWRRHLAKEGVMGTFSFRLDADRAAPWAKKYKTNLRLPAEHEFKSFIFDAAFRAYINRIRQAPRVVHHHVVCNEKAGLSIVFQPNGTGTSAIYAAYNTAHHIEHNVVYGALEKKADQIKRSGHEDAHELRGILLCDGGCGIFRGLNVVGEVSLQQIVQFFLRRSRSIQFVCCVDVHPAFLDLFSNASRLEFKTRLWTRLDATRTAALERLFQTAVTLLPSPTRNGRNAALNVDWIRDHPIFYGAQYRRGLHMSGSKITMSSRATMDFIAGRITRKEFESIVGLSVDMLNGLLDQGFTVRDLSITRLEDEDDDELTICLDGPDPATSEYRTPSTEAGPRASQ